MSNKNTTMIFNAKEFLIELDELLHATPYTSVDILPLVQKYTDSKTQSEKSSIKMTIKGLISQYKESGLIDANDDFHWQLSRQQPTHGQQLFEDPILIRSRKKFEDEYEKKHTPPVQLIHYGDVIGSIIGDTKEVYFNPVITDVKNNKTNEESAESKELTKKTLEDLPKVKWHRHWGFIVAVLAVLIMLIIELLS